MAEETPATVAEPAVPETPAPPEVTAPDPLEAKAREMGWRPSTEFEGDSEEWVDAREFIKRAPLFERLKSQGKKLKEQEKALHDMATHIDKVAAAAYNKAIADLQREKREAVQNADLETVTAIDQQIESIKVEMAPVATDKPKVHPAVDEWLGKKENEWFRTDPERATFAMAYQESLFKRNPQMDMEESLIETTKAVRKAFPDKFSNPARHAAPPVETGASMSTGGKKTYSFRDLNDEQKSVATRFQRMGIMTTDDYVKQLADSGQLGG